MKRKAIAITLTAFMLSGCGKSNINQLSAEKTDEIIPTATLSAYTDETANYEILQLFTQIKSFPKIRNADDKLVLIGGYNDEDDRYIQLFCLYDKQSGEISDYVEFYSDDMRNLIGFFKAENGFNAVFCDEITKKYILMEYDENLKYISENELSFDDAEGSITMLESLGNGEYIALDSAESCTRIMIYDSEFKLKSVLADTLGLDTDIIVNSAENVYFSDNNGVYRLDENSLKALEISLDDTDGVFSGDENYPLYVYNSEGIFGISDDKPVKVLDWKKHDINNSCLQSVGYIGNGSFLVGDMIDIFNVFVPKADKENSDEIKLTTIFCSADLEDAVKKYNRSHDNRIVIEELFTDGAEDVSTAVEDMERRLLKGEEFDIVCFNFMPYENYISKGIFADLSDEINTDSCLENIIDGMKTDGKLYYIIPSFSVKTLAGNSYYFGDKQGITIGEFVEKAKGIPDGTDLVSYPTKWSVFGEIFMDGLDNFADKRSKKCNFETPEFTDFLDFLNSYPNDRTIYFGENDDTFEESGPVAVETVNLRNMSYYSTIGANLSFNSYTLIGYPTNETGINGAKFQETFSLGMFANSSKKSEIADFFSFILSEDYQNSIDMAIPINRSAFERQANGNTEAIEFVSGITEKSYYDVNISNIVQEEMDKFFKEETTSEQTAKAIQSRVGIYVWE